MRCRMRSDLVKSGSQIYHCEEANFLRGKDKRKKTLADHLAGNTHGHDIGFSFLKVIKSIVSSKTILILGLC